MEITNNTNLGSLRHQAKEFEAELLTAKRQFERQAERELESAQALHHGLDKISIFANKMHDQQTLSTLSELSLTDNQDKQRYLQELTEQYTLRQRKIKRKLVLVNEQIATVTKRREQE